MSRDSQRYRKTYSYYRVQPKTELLEVIVDETLDWKKSVRAASTTSVALAGSTPLVIDDVTLSDEDRVLLKDQSSGSENGIYFYEVTENSYVLTRASDARSGTISCGATTYVEEGSTNSGKIYIMSTTGEISVDVTAMSWTQFSGAGGGVGGSGTSGFVSKFTAAGTIGNSIVSDDGSNVGIGTNSATGRLYVSGSSTASQPTAVIKGGVISPTGNVGLLDVQNSSGTSILFVSGTRATIGGRVGIGTNRPSALFHVSGTYAGSSFGIKVGEPNVFGVATSTYTSLQHTFYGGDGTTQRLIIDSNGNILAGGNLGFVANTARFLVSGSSTATDQGIVYKSGVSSPTGALLDIKDYQGNSIIFVSGSGLSGSLTKLTDGSSYLVAGSNVTITTGSNGSVTISSTASGGGSSPEYWSSPSSAFVYATGSVGIGSTSHDSSYKLNVYQTTNFADLRVKFEQAGADYGSKVYLVGGNTEAPGGASTNELSSLYRDELDDLQSMWRIWGGLVASNMAFDTGGVEAMRINASQNVGIGTTAVRSKLHVFGNGQTTAAITDAGDRGSFIRISHNDNTQGSGGGILFTNYQGDNANSVGFAAIKGLLYDGSGNTTGDLAVSTRSSTSSTSLTERLRITRDGKIGIGNTSPGAALDVSKSNGIPDIRLSHAGTAYMNLYGGNGVGALTLLAVQSEPLVLGTANAEKMRITSGGNVGIGTAVPDARLHIGSSGYGGSSPALKLNHAAGSGYGYAQFGDSSTNTQNWHVGSEGDGSFRWYSGNWGSGTELMRINSAGSVGVGTSNPVNKLHVVGSLRADGTGNSYVVLDGSSDGSYLQLNRGGSATQNAFVSQYQGQLLIKNLDSGPIVFTNTTSDVERVRIDTSGNVGIGTYSYSSRLYVSGSSSSTAPTVVVRAGVNSAAGVGVLDVQDSSGSPILYASGSRGVGIGTNDSGLSLIRLYVSSSYTGNLASALIVGQQYGSSINTYKAQNHLFQLADTTEAMRINASGVGIGTSTITAARLHVQGTSTGSDTTLLVRHNVANGSDLPVVNVQNSGGTSLFHISGSGDVGIGTSAVAGTSLTVYRDNNNASVLTYGVGTKDGNNVTSGYYFATYNPSGPVVRAGSLSVTSSGNTELSCYTSESGKSLRFLTGGSSSTPTVGMVITAENGVAGKVGIGTTIPLQNLQIGSNTPASTSTPDAISLGGTYSSTAGANSKLRLYDDGVGTVMGIGVSSGKMDYSVAAGNGHSWYIGGAEKVTMDPGGVFYTNSILPNADNTYVLGLQWGVNIAWAAVYSYSYPSLSDYRTKKNVTSLTGSLEKLINLNPVTYEYNNFVNQPEKLGTRVGFIAHEMQEVFPNLVSGSKDATAEDGSMVTQTIYQDDLIPYIVDALKQLKQENETLKREIESIKSSLP